MDRTINEVVKNNLCAGCGTCVAVCPKEAIKLTIDKGRYTPKINSKKCTKCGICYKVCPSYSTDCKVLNNFVFGQQPKNKLIGNFVGCYVGYSKDTNIRYNSSSGGLITQILVSALEKGRVDGALVTKMNEKKPLEPLPFIARTKEEIILASGSKYCPVPANIALREILKKEGKYAVVGLPCQIQGIRKAEMMFPKLRERIVLHLGIVCNHTPSFLATENLLKQNGIKKEDVLSIRYRGEGWPGKMLIRTRKKNYSIPLPKYWNTDFGKKYKSERCLKCKDAFCELADISCMDAWLKEYSNDSLGTSIFVVRKDSASNLLNKLHTTMLIEKIDICKVVMSQPELFKKRKSRFLFYAYAIKNLFLRIF